MGSPFDQIKNTKVPLVGQLVEVLAIRPMVVAKCTCSPQAPVFTITDPQEIGRCAVCGRGFMIKDFSFKNVAGDIEGSCTLSQVVRRPAPSIGSAGGSGGVVTDGN